MNEEIYKSLEQNAEILAEVNTKEKLCQLALITKNRLKTKDLTKEDPIFLNFITNNFLAKIFCLIQSRELPYEIINFINFLLEKDLIKNKIHLEILKKKYSGLKIGREIILKKEWLEKKNFDTSFNELLNLDKEKEKILQRKFGFSFLDLNGDFIWFDKKTRDFFEIQNLEKKRNFFDYMIPFSKHKIHKKFCEKGNSSIFKNEEDLEKSFNFPYVIYSKDNLENFIKHLKKKENKNFKEIKNQNSKKIGKSLYFKYLKGLSSNATYKILKIKKKEFQNLQKSQNFANYNFGNIKNKKKSKKENEKKKKKIKRSNLENFPNKEFTCDVFLNKNNLIQIETTEDDDEDEFIYKEVILLKTRLTRKKQQFDFDKMKNDVQILEFEKIVRDRFK